MWDIRECRVQSAVSGLLHTLPTDLHYQLSPSIYIPTKDGITIHFTLQQLKQKLSPPHRQPSNGFQLDLE